MTAEQAEFWERILAEIDDRGFFGLTRAKPRFALHIRRSAASAARRRSPTDDVSLGLLQRLSLDPSREHHRAVESVRRSRQGISRSRGARRLTTRALLGVAIVLLGAILLTAIGFLLALMLG